jgi:RNA polymerase sigma-70 factor (sigma-E family)
VEDDFDDYARARQHHLYRTAYLLCGDRDRAQDLVQTTLVALLRSWSKARLADNPDAYAKKALIRAYLDEQRKLRRQIAAHLKAASRPDSTAYSHATAEGGTPGARRDSGAVDAGTESTELRMVVREALRALPPKPRAMVVLRYWEDLSVEQTAELLGCSPGNVKSQCSRALAKLRPLLGERLSEPVDL